MRKLLITALLVTAASSWAQTTTVQTLTDKGKALTDKAKTAAVAITLCDTETFEQATQPAWAVGNTVKVNGTTLAKQ